MDELNQNVPVEEESVGQENALKCDQNMPKKSKTPALFKAGIALMCATSALSLGAIGACGVLGYKLYKNQKKNNTKTEDSMGSVVTNKTNTITISSDGYWVIDGVKTNTKAEATNGSNGLSVVNASVVKLDKWGITTQMLFTMSDDSYFTTTPQTQVLNDHYYEASSMSDVMTLIQGYNVSKIKLTENIKLSSSLEFSNNTTFDLNRKTLTYTATTPIEVAEESSLTFKNGSLSLQSDTGISVEGANAELSFEKVNLSATKVVAETLEDNASINLENCSFVVAEPDQMVFSAGQGRASSVESLFVIKGSNANLAIKGSKFETSKAIVSASNNAESVSLAIKETKLSTSAPIFDIDTTEVVPTLDIDNDTINKSTISELNTTPITSGTFSVDPTELGAKLEGVETFNVNGSSVLASDFASLVELVEAGSTITLHRDIDLETTLEINKKLTINLDNYTLSARANETGRGILNVVAGGALTIDADEQGMIDGVCSGYWHIAVRVSGGKATINGGRFTNIGATNPDDPNDMDFDLLYVSGGELTVNGGMFQANNPKWTINIKDQDKANSKISVNGGLFLGYNPEASETENPVANFVSEGNIVVSDGFHYMVVSAEYLAEAVTIEEINYISLHSDVELKNGFVINKELTLNLNSYTISAPSSASSALFKVDTNGVLTIEGEGTINSASNANDYSMAVWARNGGQVVINGGTFTNLGAKSVEDDGVTPNNNELIYVSGSGSLITINAGTFIGNSENAKWGTRYTLNKQDGCASSIVVNGGTFVKYNPAESLSENPIDNFVAEGKFVVKTGDNFIVANGTLQEVMNSAQAGSTIILTNDIVLTAGIVLNKELTLNIGNFEISAPEITDIAVFKVENNGKLTINADEEGGINSASQNNDYSMAVWARNGGQVVINGGFFTNDGAKSIDDNKLPNNNELIYTSGNGSSIIINNGWFMGNTSNEKWGTRYTLNKHDSTNSSIVVNGGYFYQFNPEASQSENPIANFVSEGNIVVSDGETYMVVSAEYLAEAVAIEEINYISLHSNVELETGLVINRQLKINLNSYTISAPTSASSALLKVDANGFLTIEGNGTINSASNANDYSMAVWARNGGIVVINGGTFTNLGAKSVEDDGVTPNNNELIYVSGSESWIIINAGTFIGNSENAKWGTRYTLNKQDGCTSSICVYGGTFVKYDPSMSKSENPIANFVAQGKLVYKVGDNYTVAPASELVNVINNNAGATITLFESFVVTTELTINLNGCTICAPHSESTSLFKVDTNGVLTIEGEGTINSASNANDYSMAVWARNGGIVVINGGTFTNLGAKSVEDDGVTPNNNELIYVSGSESWIIINAGTFIGNSENAKWGTRYTLNKQDGCASSIVVNGGTFVGYNPSESLSENPIDNFVPETHFVYRNGTSFSVAPQTDIARIVATEGVDYVELNNHTIIETALVINKKITFNLKDFFIAALEDTIGDGIFHVVEGGDLTIEAGDEGGIYAVTSSPWHMAVWVDGGKATINGGNYTNILNFDEEPDESVDMDFDLFYVSGGTLIINGGLFEANNPKWTINVKDNKHSTSTVIVNGGYFFDYNPAKSETENPVANFVGENKAVIGFYGLYTVIDAKDLEEAVNSGYTANLFGEEMTVNIDYVCLTSNVEIKNYLLVSSELTIDLNGYTISAPHTTSTALIYVSDFGYLTIEGNGTINSASDSNDYSMAIWAYNGGIAVINGGTFTNKGAKSFEDDGTTPNNNELIYVSGSGSLITINAGTFIGNSDNKTWGTRYTLNKQDGCASTIVVNGGTFVKYDPSMSASENPIANFVAEGYTVEVNGDYYVVVEETIAE